MVLKDIFEKHLFNADIRRLHADTRRFYQQGDNLRESAFPPKADPPLAEDLRKSAFKVFFLMAILTLVTFDNVFAQDQNTQESDQQISEFSLTGYGEKGKKTWDIFGKSADIFTDIVKLKDIVSNLYGEKEDIRLTADKGDFNKVDGNIHADQNVVITTSTGAKLTTDSLDWDRENKIITTKDTVNIERGNMTTIAQGAKAEPNLNRVTLGKDVRVDIDHTSQENPGPDEKNKTTITCDGPLEIDYANNIAIFKNNVKVDREDLQIFSDIMEVYFSTSEDKRELTAGPSPVVEGSQIEKIICKGNVKILRGENVSYSDEAIYSAVDKKITLIGKPKLIIYSTEDLKNASSGN